MPRPYSFSVVKLLNGQRLDPRFAIEPYITRVFDPKTGETFIRGGDEVLAVEQGDSATAAGPAFEGMNISCGMRAASGAIERVALTSEGEVEIGVIGDVELSGICGSGLMDLVAMLLKGGIIGKSDRFASPSDSSTGLLERLEGGGVRENEVIIHCVLDGRRDMQTLLQQRLLR